MEGIVETWEKPEDLVLAITGYYPEGKPYINEIRERMTEMNYDQDKYRHRWLEFKFLGAIGQQIQFPLARNLGSTFIPTA